MSSADYLKQIEECIAAAPVGSALITSNFLDIADSAAVRKALSRLTDCGKIRRIICGVYDRPRFSSLLQEFEAPTLSRPHGELPAIADGISPPAGIRH